MKKVFAREGVLEHDGVLYKRFSGIVVDSKEVFDSLPKDGLVFGEMLPEEYKTYVKQFEDRIFELGGLEKILKIFDPVVVSVKESVIVNENDGVDLNKKDGENDGLSDLRTTRTDDTQRGGTEKIPSSSN